MPEAWANHVTVLLSGGIDSTATIAFYAAQGATINPLYVDYGQSARAQELLAANAVAGHFGLELRIISCTGFPTHQQGCVPGRNAFLLLSALLASEFRPQIIAIGIHSGVPYYDCNEAFVAQIQKLFDGYTSGKVQIGAPFLEWSKGQILDYARHVEAPLHLTYSCELGRTQPCGECMTCKDLEALDAIANVGNTAPIRNPPKDTDIGPVLLE